MDFIIPEKPHAKIGAVSPSVCPKIHEMSTRN
jgi:hypothetical protein